MMKRIRVISNLAKRYVCEKCVELIKKIVEPDKKLSCYDQVKFGNSFCYLRDRSNYRGRSDEAVTARTRIGWIFIEESFVFINNLRRN